MPSYTVKKMPYAMHRRVIWQKIKMPANRDLYHSAFKKRLMPKPLGLEQKVISMTPLKIENTTRSH